VCYKDPILPPGWRGQFDPTKDEIYDYLDDIYREIVETFKPSLFHMGGDEVNLSCWNSSESIRNWMLDKKYNLEREDFMNLWGYFQEKAIERLDKYLDKNIKIIVWTSTLTEEPFLSRLLNKDRYIVQIWSDSTDKGVTKLLENGYHVIFSNSDALYLDCGVGGWVNEGLNWCWPYRRWQQIYNNKLDVIAGAFIDQVYGAEATIWSESIDEANIDMRIWPRASALAERLWAGALVFLKYIY
jgi:hexosaminidase